MSDPTRLSKPPLPPAVCRQLDGLRAAIRRYVWLEGLAALAVWSGLWFWGTMAIDWLAEPPRLIRAALLAVGGIGLAAALFLYILRRAFVAWSNSNLAMVLERRFPELNDSLLTAVELLDRETCPAEFNPGMLANTSHQAGKRVDSLRYSEVFNPMPLVRKAVIAAGLAGMVGLLAWQLPDKLELWVQRNVFLSNKTWPRKIRLEAVGFTDGVAKVGVGANFDLRVRAYRGDTDIPVLPDEVMIRYRIEGGGRERKAMKTIGAQAGPDAAQDEVLQEYGYAFSGISSTIHIDIAGGDAYLSNLTLQVVPNPSLALSIRCRYPDYMERKPATIPSGVETIVVPVGCTLTVSGTANKPLDLLRIDRPADERREAWNKQISGEELGDGGTTFEHVFDPFPARKKSEKTAEPVPDHKLQFTLLDSDGIKSREPIKLSFVPLADTAPEVKVHLVGTRERVVTEKGRVPVTGDIRDDHGLGRAWFGYTVEDWPTAKPAATPEPGGDASKPPPPAEPTARRSGELPFGDLASHPAEYSITEAAIEGKDLKLSIGQKLVLAVRAADLYNLTGGPNIGSGDTWRLDVVSERDLLIRLDASELALRERFKTIIQEMTETRNLLLKMDFAPPDKDGSSGSKPPVAGDEPGEKEAEAPRLSAEELTARRIERLALALQNCRKNALETKEVAAGVDEIRLQLTNNHVDSAERKSRLDQGVSQPLHHLIDQMFPVLEHQLEDLQPRVADITLGPKYRDVALKQADEILVQMRQILQRMITLGDFNIEVVQRLQKLIERQKELSQRTAQREGETLGEKEE